MRHTRVSGEEAHKLSQNICPVDLYSLNYRIFVLVQRPGTENRILENTQQWDRCHSV